MKVLLIVPEIRLDNVPYFWPFWAGIFASIVEQKNQQVAILDLNSLRTKFPNTNIIINHAHIILIGIILVPANASRNVAPAPT